MIHPPSAPLKDYPFTRITPPVSGRNTNFFSSSIDSASSGLLIKTIATVYGPHLIRSITFRTGTPPNIAILQDILLADNPSTLSGAQLTDRHLSELTGLNQGLPGGTDAIRYTINTPVLRSITYYKHLRYNNTAGTVTFMAILELHVLGAR